MYDKGVSIITPIHRESCIENTIKNYIRQEIENKELIIIINNCTLDIDSFKHYVDKYPNIKVYKINGSVTLGECLNYGVEKSKFDIIAKFDSDDYYGRLYLKEALNIFKSKDCHIVGKSCIHYYIDDLNKLLLWKIGNPNNYSNFIGGQTICFKKEIFNKVKFRAISLGEDQTFIQDCINNNYKIYSGSEFNFLAFRSKNLDEHTWKVNDKTIISLSSLVKENVKFEDCFKLVEKFMNIKIEHVTNTFNYGSMMMGISIINQLNKELNNIKIYIDVMTPKDLERLKLETKATNLYANDTKVKKDVIIVLGGDDFSQVYCPSLEYLKGIFKPIVENSKEKLVILIGQTIGPFSKEGEKIAIESLKNAKIYTRDDKNLEYLKSSNYQNIFMGRDLAFTDLPRQDEVKYILKKYNLDKDNYICFVPTGLVQQYKINEAMLIENIVNMLKNILADKRLEKKKILLLPHVLKYTDDREIVKKIFKRLNELQINYGDRITAIYDVLVPSEARELLGNGLFTITFRMHAAVSTFYMRKPAISLSYSPKYEGVLGRGLDMNELVIESATPNLFMENKLSELVNEKVDFVLKNYDSLINKIDKNVTKTTAILEEEFKDIINLIKECE